jgi:hypothetical protein
MSGSSNRTRARASSPAGGDGHAAWRESCRSPRQRDRSVPAPKAHGPNPPTNHVAAGGDAAAEANPAASPTSRGRRGGSRLSPACPVQIDRRGSPDRNGRGAPVTGGPGEATPHPDPPPHGGRENCPVLLLGGRGNCPVLPQQRRDYPEEVRREGKANSHAGAAAAVAVGAAVPGRTVRQIQAGRQALVTARARAETARSREFAGIEWTSEALA